MNTALLASPLPESAMLVAAVAASGAAVSWGGWVLAARDALPAPIDEPGSQVHTGMRQGATRRSSSRHVSRKGELGRNGRQMPRESTSMAAGWKWMAPDAFHAHGNGPVPGRRPD